MTTTAGPWPDLSKKPDIPFFETEADRDRRYAEWVAAGHTLVNGMYCCTRGASWMRFKGEWRQVG